MSNTIIEYKQLRVTINSSFKISLTQTSGTGFKWFLKKDEQFLEMVDEKSNLTSHKPGSEITIEFELNPIKTGETVIEATYKRSWESSYFRKIVYKITISNSA
jgi:predicted secreted protein